MKKYILYNNELSIENIRDVADTEDEIREQYKMARIFKRMLGQEDCLKMALVEMSETDLEMISEKAMSRMTDFIERPFLKDKCEKCTNHYLLDDESRCRKIKVGQSDAMCVQVVRCNCFKAKDGAEE